MPSHPSCSPSLPAHGGSQRTPRCAPPRQPRALPPAASRPGCDRGAKVRCECHPGSHLYTTPQPYRPPPAPPQRCAARGPPAAAEQEVSSAAECGKQAGAVADRLQGRRLPDTIGTCIRSCVGCTAGCAALAQAPSPPIRTMAWTTFAPRCARSCSSRAAARSRPSCSTCCVEGGEGQGAREAFWGAGVPQEAGLSAHASMGLSRQARGAVRPACWAPRPTAPPYAPSQPSPPVPPSRPARPGRRPAAPPGLQRAQPTGAGEGHMHVRGGHLAGDAWE